MGSPLQHHLPLPPKMHWPKVFWGFTGTERDYVPKPQTIGKSGRVRPPWFFKNPQLAPCLPQCPGLAPQHHDLLCPRSTSKGLPRPCWGHGPLGSVTAIPSSRMLWEAREPASPQLALPPLHQALWREGMIWPALKV